MKSSVSVMANSAANEGNVEEAKKCGRISNGFSIAGIIITVVLIIVFVVIYAADVNTINN